MCSDRSMQPYARICHVHIHVHTHMHMYRLWILCLLCIFDFSYALPPASIPYSLPLTPSLSLHYSFIPSSFLPYSPPPPPLSFLHPSSLPPPPSLPLCLCCNITRQYKATIPNFFWGKYELCQAGLTPVTFCALDRCSIN